MKARNHLLLASAIVSLAGGCASGDGGQESSQPAHALEAPLSETSIGGIVTSVEGKALADASVSLGSGQKVTTAADGTFLMTGLAPTARLPITVQAAGHASTVHIASVEAGQRHWLRIPLQALEAPLTFPAELGTTLALPGGGTLEILPNSLVTSDKGVPASGDIRAVRANWEATQPAILAAAPGDFTALEPDGTTTRLQSFGMFRVELSDALGQPLIFQRDRPGRIRLPVTEQFEGLPLDNVGLYAFEPIQGMWRLNQVLTLNSSGLVLQGVLIDPSVAWNFDMPQDTTCIIFKVMRTDYPNPNTFVSGATWQAVGINYNGISQGFSDANGNACANVRKNSSVSLNAFWNDGTNDWTLPAQPIINPTPNNTALCEVDQSACTVIEEPVLLERTVGGL